jgi:hypothetical protein
MEKETDHVLILLRNTELQRGLARNMMKNATLATKAKYATAKMLLGDASGTKGARCAQFMLAKEGCKAQCSHCHRLFKKMKAFKKHRSLCARGLLKSTPYTFSPYFNALQERKLYFCYFGCEVESEDKTRIAIHYLRHTDEQLRMFGTCREELRFQTG